jgi:glycosyltransferase involved in cell wall biosynthesis
MHPLVSILIPAFNAGRWIGETIRSALGQTWPRKEIIVVDDGSTDQTLSLARQFASKEVSVVTQANQGAAAARNKAFALCQGDWIQWLDADDLMAPEKISCQLAAEDDRAAETLHACAFATFYRYPQGAVRVSRRLYRDLDPADWLVAALDTGDWLPPHAWLVSRRLTQHAGPWDERLSLNDDGEYFCRLVSLSSRVKFHDQTLCFYRTGNTRSLSRTRSEKALQSLLLSVRLTIDHLLKRDRGQRGLSAALAFVQYNVDEFGVSDPRVWDGFRELARELGGELRRPAQSRKLRMARALLGEDLATQLKAGAGQAKGLALRERERILSLLAPRR